MTGKSDYRTVRYVTTLCSTQSSLDLAFFASVHGEKGVLFPKMFVSLVTWLRLLKLCVSRSPEVVFYVFFGELARCDSEA